MTPARYLAPIARRVLLMLMQLSLSAFVVSAAEAGEAVEMTPSEQLYLQRLGTVHFCVDPDWAPFEVIDDAGQHAGIAADLLALVAERTGVPLRLLKTRDWPESLQASRAGRCQVMSLLNQTPARDDWLIFTQPILTDDNVLVAREEHSFVVDLASQEDQTMVLPKGSSIEERVRREFPRIKLILTDTEAQALQMVSDRTADMTMRSLIVAAYTIKREGWFNLKIAGQVPGYGNQLRIGVMKDDTVLRDILNKGVASITPVERQQIIDRHITISMTTGIDYGPVKQLAAVLALVLLTSLFWLRKLKRLNTDLRQSEAALQESQKIARLGSYVIDVATRDWTSSDIFDEVFGLEPANQRHESEWIEIIHPAYRDHVLAHFNNTVAGEQQSFDTIYRVIRRNDQAERWIHGLGKMAVDAQGRPLRMIGTIQDITERKRAELQLNQAKDIAEQTAAQQRQFIAMLSHEVRTPLAVIDATAQVLTLRLSDDVGKLSLVSRIRRGAARLAYFFDNCLTADRIDSHNFSVQPGPVDVGKLVTGVVESAVLLSPEHRIVPDIEPGLPALLGDPVLLRVLLMNLLGNALKYAPETTPVLLRVWRKRDAPALCCLAVEDQGPGIPPDEIELIFQKYQRGRAAEGTPGAGLGLSVVERIAKLHGGTVCADSQAGQGTRFTVEIPFQT